MRGCVTEPAASGVLNSIDLSGPTCVSGGSLLLYNNEKLMYHFTVICSVSFVRHSNRCRGGVIDVVSHFPLNKRVVVVLSSSVCI